MSPLPSFSHDLALFSDNDSALFSNHDSALFAVLLDPLVVHDEEGVGEGGKGFYLVINVRFEHFFFTFRIIELWIFSSLARAQEELLSCQLSRTK